MTRRAHRTVGFVLIGLVVVGSAYYTARSYSDPAYTPEDYPALASFLRDKAGPEDVVVLNAKFQYPVFRYYYDGQLPIVGLPGEYPLDMKRTDESLGKLVDQYSAIWVVNGRPFMADPSSYVERALGQRAFRGDSHWFGPRLDLFVPGRAADLNTAALANRTSAVLAGRFKLLGYELSPPQLVPGETIKVRLFWQALQAGAEDYSVFVQLIGRQKRDVLAQQDGPALRGAHTTSKWEQGEILRDDYALKVPDGATSGAYELIAGMYRLPGAARLPVVQDGASVPDSTIRLQMLKVPLAAPSTPAGTMVAGPRFGNNIQLLQHRVPTDVRPDQGVLPVELLWQAPERTAEDYTVFVQLLDAEGRLRSQIDEQPVSGRYPTSIWDPGEIVPDRHLLPLPRGLAPGRYAVIAGLYSSQTLKRLPVPAANADDYVQLTTLYFGEAQAPNP